VFEELGKKDCENIRVSSGFPIAIYKHSKPMRFLHDGTNRIVPSLDLTPSVSDSAIIY
jgi:hypothetical protein